MNCVGRRIAIFVILLSASVLPAVAQGRNSVTGFVFGPDRTPVQRVYVELQTEWYLTVGRAQTNGSGMYTFRGLAQGLYIVKILAGGTDYVEQVRSVSLVPISASGAVSQQVDFYLNVKTSPGKVRGPAAVVFAQEIPKNAQDLYEAGIDDLDKKNESDGFAKLKQAIELFPSYYLALDRLATEYLAKGYFEAAYVLYTHSVRANPRSISSGLGLGLAEYRMNRLAKSVEAFDEVLNLDKSNVNAYYWKGVVLHASKKFGDAVTALQKADTLGEGKVADVHFQLARVYKDQKKFHESAESLETYLILRPDAPNAAEIRAIIKTLREKPAS